MTEKRNEAKRLPVADLLAVLGGLLVLMGASVGSAFIDLGGWNTFISLCLAVAMALLVLVFFMQLRHAAALLRFVVAIAFIWLALLIVISFGDYFTRIIIPPPW